MWVRSWSTPHLRHVSPYTNLAIASCLVLSALYTTLVHAHLRSITVIPRAVFLSRSAPHSFTLFLCSLLSVDFNLLYSINGIAVILSLVVLPF